ncbi:ABC transporter permease [Dyella sp.]|uniref:ABC transporter permease n=1 Tax=Dyella sp. TaxID=1869338 RepID=UPI002ED16BE5
MFAYYLDLAWRSMRRSKVLTALMVLAIALGIGASMTTLTVLHVLSGDPIPGRSGSIFYPQLDPQDMDGYQPKDPPPEQVTWIDGMNLLHAARADHQALMTGGSVPVQPAQASIDPFYADARYTTSDFFTMFGVPFSGGTGWTALDDDRKARVAVISKALSDKLYGAQGAVGKVLRIKDVSFQVIGVLGDWHPNPHFYDLNIGNYAEDEDVYLPLSTSRDLELAHNGSNDCWGRGGEDARHFETASCVWLQLWVQILDPAKVAAYKQYLIHYSLEQKALGRFQRPPNVRLMNVMQWLNFMRVVPGDVRLQAWLALGFLAVCLINVVGLMLAKFLRRSPELGVRRALGASRRDIFVQLLVESGMVGLAGGAGGLLLAMIGLWLVRRQPSDYASLAHLDMTMLLATFTLALFSTLCAGLLPAWRACLVTPALQLKSQ